ncbi:cilia- and flagella-associated protein 68-like [Amphiura filiformis]|uniref:cilia- and flagella-associated protein 68-like n=1 Tax=Amphiura filiformis TaxID=82378 RepID=UPI003B21A1F0
MTDDVAFRSMIRASGLGEVWTHTTDEEKFKQYGWRTTTKEDCYSPNTLVGNWCEEKFDINRTRVPKRLPSQYEHYFESTHEESYGKQPKPVAKELLHLSAPEARAFPASQPEIDPPSVKQEYNSFQTTSRAAYVDPRLRTAPMQGQTFCKK